MSAQNSSDTSVAIVRKALPQMSQLGIAITPPNYAVWYEYLHAQNASLKREMDDVLESGQVSSERIADFYERYIKPGDEALLQRAEEGLRGLLAVFRDKVDETGAHLSNYGDTLDNFSALIGANIQTDDLATFIANLMKETDVMADHNGAMQKEIADVSGNIADFQSQLESTGPEATIDQLTGLSTRTSFAESLEQVAADALATDTHTPCLVCIEIDEFEQIVESEGEGVGDLVIRYVAQSLKRNIKGKDTAARFKGGQFAVLLADAPASGASAAAEILRAAVEADAVSIEGRPEPINVTISLGVGWFRQDEPFDDFVERADAVLFLATAAGGNRITVDR